MSLFAVWFKCSFNDGDDAVDEDNSFTELQQSSEYGCQRDSLHTIVRLFYRLPLRCNLSWNYVYLLKVYNCTNKFLHFISVLFDLSHQDDSIRHSFPWCETLLHIGDFLCSDFSVVHHLHCTVFPVVITFLSAVIRLHRFV